jgi:hypothetical protein
MSTRRAAPHPTARAGHRALKDKVALRMRTVVWFRGKDLRIGDHQALAQAAHDGETIPLFVIDPYFAHYLRYLV